MIRKLIEEYIESEWNHHRDGTYDLVITDVPGCASFIEHVILSSNEKDLESHIRDSSVDRLIGYWFRKS